MIEIWPTSTDIGLREMAESSLQIDPHNANPFIVLVHRLCAKNASGNEAMVLSARIPEIDPTSPYAPYIFSIVIKLLHNCTLRAYWEL